MNKFGITVTLNGKAYVSEDIEGDAKVYAKELFRNLEGSLSFRMTLFDKTELVLGTCCQNAVFEISVR